MKFLKYILTALMIHGCGPHAFAVGPDPVQNEFYAAKNLLLNPGFENGKAKWSFTTTANVTIQTDGTGAIGKNYASWDASASSEVFASANYTVTELEAGRNGVATCQISVPSGTATHKMGVYVSATEIAVTDIVSSTTTTKNVVNFIFPAAGQTVNTTLYSVASNEPAIRIFNCHLGLAEGYNVAPIRPQDVFSALVTDGSATTTVSQENLDWINGNCTNPSGGNYTCTFNSGVFTVAPNCWCSSIISDDGGCQLTGSATTSSVSLKTEVAASGADSDQSFNLFCQKQGADATATQLAFKPDVLASSWSGYHDNTCSWARTNTAYGDPTADASCALVQRVNRNFGTVSTSGSVLPAITFTPSRAGAYWVCASTAVAASSSGGDLGLKLWDGTTTIAESDVDQEINLASHLNVCGLYNATSTSAVTLSLQSKASAGSVTIRSVTAASAIEWSIIQIYQALPAPLLVNSVVTPSSGVIKVAVVAVANACTSTPCTIAQQTGSWVSSITRGATGVYTVNYTGFSAAPMCFTSATKSTYTDGCRITTAATTTSLIMTCTDPTSANTDTAFQVMCVGAP